VARAGAGRSHLLVQGLGLDGRADLLAVAFSLAALAAWTRDREARGWALPALAAAALLTKATSVTVPLALAAWALGRRDAATLGRFAWRFAACVLTGLLVTLPAHGPSWYASVLRTLLTAAPGTSNFLRPPAELIRYLGACGELACSRRSRSAAVRAADARDAAGRICRRFAAHHARCHGQRGLGPEPSGRAGRSGRSWRSGVGRAAPLAARAPRPGRAHDRGAGGTWRDLLPAVRHAGAAGNVRADVIAAVRAEPGPVLTEDALIALAAGHRPAISDAAPLRPLSLQRDPRALRWWRRSTSGAFPWSCSTTTSMPSARWYRIVYLGEPVTIALKARYRAAGVVDGYYLYRPSTE
jgi:hypothetical protein